MNLYPFKCEHFNHIKAAYSNRRVDLSKIATLLNGNVKPQVGDLVLAKIDKIGQHTRIELATGRKAQLFPGDEIIVSYGNRYAPDQFEAIIPEDLSPCHLVAAGGLASKMLSKHTKISAATTITPLGLLGDIEGKRINLKDWTLPATSYIGQLPPTIAVVGSSMNSGKTTTVANLIQGLHLSGLKVGAAKITGTGAGGDIWLMKDAGANFALDFTDMGFPSTYKLSSEKVERIFLTLTHYLAAQEMDVIILEIADGLYQEETATLVSSPTFRQGVQGVLFAANSALGATSGQQWLKQYQLPLLGVSGTITMSPLAMKEAVTATGLPIFTCQQLQKAAIELISHPQRINYRFTTTVGDNKTLQMC
ncbi:MAG: DUF1611 domain-containing protein [Crocosphaera sp.]|nr:DUF1611 domain-containing protein [Crocosphaera sp.]